MPAVIVGGVFLPNLLDAFDNAHPAAAAPPDLCAAIGPALFERLVPNGAPLTGATYSSGSDASCDYMTANNRSVGHDEYGDLHVRLLRYGRIAWNSGADRASDTVGKDCDGSSMAGRFHRLKALGDEACTAYSDEGQGGVAYGSAVIRRGADVLWIDFYTHPGTADQARQAVTEVASASLAGIA